jgi:molecular chaperone GrpE
MGREEILRRFEEWLDRALSEEEPPRGVDLEIFQSLNASGGDDESAGADAYSLWSAMTALTQEIKLQGRSFKELSATIEAQPARMAEREREEIRRVTERRHRKETLETLIDLRDRLERGRESVRESETELAKAAQRGWLDRLFRRPASDPAADAFSALKKGYEMGIERLDQTLAEFHAREIACEGQQFDPRRMNAVDREETNAVADGTVTAVYRRGYEWNGEVFRPAQVRVACAPAGKVK